MGKYNPLGRHLRRQKGAIYEMTFRDIERVHGALLPRAAYRPQWWASEAPDAAHRVAWMAAGYEADADVAAERVRFARPACEATANSGNDLV